MTLCFYLSIDFCDKVHLSMHFVIVSLGLSEDSDVFHLRRLNVIC